MKRIFFTLMLIITGTTLAIDNDSLLSELQHKMKFNKIQIEAFKQDLFQPSDFEPKKAISSKQYLQSINLSTGYSSSTTRTNNYLTVYCDTSRNSIQINQQSPVFTFSHNIALGNIFSLAYSVGYQQMQIDLNHSKFSSFKSFVFIHPQLTLFNNKRFSGYSKLNIGLVYEDIKVEQLNSNAMTYFLPPHFKFYTGFTPIGLSFKISQQFSLNSEISIWSFESFNVGLKYNFKKNKDYNSKY